MLTATNESASSRPVRADIQGLRALAVVAVILDHVIGWPAGGFVGVDVFFVISGFLITGLLLAEHRATGRVSLPAFYARRVRRIAPAAVTVLAATVVAAWFLFNQPRFFSTVGDAVSSLLLVSNWRFAAEGVDYFQAGDAVSPLQHFWSLSVEEQFYLVWPALVLLVLLLAGFGSRGGVSAADAGDAAGSGSAPARPDGVRGPVLLGVVLAIVVAGSFVFALGQSASSPATAYFSTLTRVWELGAGALLAVAAPLFGRLPTAARVLLGWLGLGGILLSFFVIDDAVLFPAPWAALPVAATALVLVAGAGSARQRYLAPIANPLTSFVGDVSYSLYLWHFPVLVFVLMVLPEQTPVVTATILGLTAALSLVSYFLVEQPLHRSPWLRRRPPAGAWAAWRERFGAQFILSSLALAVVAVVVVVGVQLTARGTGPYAGLAVGSTLAPVSSADPGTSAGPDAGTQDPAADPAAPPAPSAEDVLQDELWAAAAATAWPSDLSPTMDAAIAETSSRNPARACFDIGATPDVGQCSWGDQNAPHRMYLVGDSTAMAYAPAFKAMAEGSGGQWRITTIGLYGCRFTDVLVQNDGAGVMDACPQRKADVAALIQSDAPQLVVVSNAFALGQSADRRPLSAADLVASEFAEAAQYGAAGRVVYLAPPPLGADLGRCYSPVTSPQDCNAGIDPAWQEFADATTAALAAPGAAPDHFVSSLGFSCAEGYCPAFAGRLPVKYDTVHLTPEFSARIAPVLQQELASQGLM